MSNRIREAFEDIRAEDALKENTRAFLSQKISQSTKKKPKYRLGYAIALVCSLFVFLGFGGYFTYNTQASAISIDINPSIEIGINRFDRVISVEGFNDDGIRLISQLDIKHKNYLDAINMIMSSESMSDYIDDDSLITFTVLADSDQQSSEMLGAVQNCNSCRNRNVQCYSGNNSYTDAAHDAGLSFGKYRAYLELQSYDSSVTVEEVRNMNMRQIQNRIDSCSGSDDSSESEYGNGYGASNGYQNGAASGSEDGYQAENNNCIENMNRVETVTGGNTVDGSDTGNSSESGYGSDTGNSSESSYGSDTGNSSESSYGSDTGNSSESSYGSESGNGNDGASSVSGKK